MPHKSITAGRVANCRRCGKEFPIVLGGTMRYCSLYCGRHRTTNDRVCDICGIAYHKGPSYKHFSGGQFCGQACYLDRWNNDTYFWTRFDRSGDCWLWRGTKERSTGYGAVLIAGTYWLTHRLAWTRTYGEIPDGLEVLHRCDIRLCGNVAHLFLGTQADNMADMTAKGRHWRRGSA